ncbi:MAG TPA: efflux RND transporter periplasmic adaptor subunit [Gammaproteobacteria bacterium]|nr:efflux transporter periplasmic adaptor subunit [Gammaproteobacteria bacterium]HBF07906.1 efflux RND transporter periplasmic adaptor subunit [Gammaproteobacteria bacterium]HCK93796.1 efflux RND transporter periplasmic adaptor subunit [Gammaproteobacteria bacterium]|tara:strand:- start:41746 stop:42885 length:1140 start_codon:yes stop_codon:yes gene_type:complete
MISNFRLARLSIYTMLGLSLGTLSVHVSAAQVSVKPAEQQEIQTQKSLPGRIVSFQQSQVRPQVDGIIVARLFEEGSYVEKGQQLFQIDDTRYEALLNRAKASHQSAAAEVARLQLRQKRYRNLLKTNAVSQQEFDDIQVELHQAQALESVAASDVELAQVNLDYTKVYAPIAGYISKAFVSQGALVSTNQTEYMALITQLDPVYVDLSLSGMIDPQFSQSLANNKSIPFSLNYIRGNNTIKYEQTGALKFSEMVMDESTAATQLRGVIANPDGVLRPGMFVRARVETGSIAGVLVPQRATTRTKNGALKLFVVNDNNTVEERVLNNPQEYQDQWLVQDGIKSGEKIVMEGYQKVGVGDSVETVDWSAPQVTQNEDVFR